MIMVRHPGRNDSILAKMRIAEIFLRLVGYPLKMAINITII